MYLNLSQPIVSTHLLIQNFDAMKRIACFVFIASVFGVHYVNAFDHEAILWEPKVQKPIVECKRFHLKECRDVMYTMLRTVETWLSVVNATWWLDYGLLLGSVRHADLNPCDYDGDVGVLFQSDAQYQQYSRFVRDAIDAHPRYKRWSGHAYPQTHIVIDTVTKAHLDLFTFRRVPNSTVMEHLNRERNVHELTDVLPTRQCRLSTMVFPCPAKPVNVLAKQYVGSRLFAANGCKMKGMREAMFTSQFEAMQTLRNEGFPSLLDAFPNASYPSAANIQFF